jgi:hypothetical protein
MKVKYVGPHDAVEIASGGQVWLAENGETVEVPDDVAAGLVGQETFEQVTTGRKATTTKDEGER